MIQSIFELKGTHTEFNNEDHKYNGHKAENLIWGPNQTFP